MGSVGQFGGMGMKAAGAYESAVSQKISNRVNSGIAAYQASQAVQNGQANVETTDLQVAHVKGQQRASMGANGVDLGQGSATDVLASTDLLGDRDKATIMDNALRTAWGYKVQEAGYDNANRSIHPGLAAFSSLLGSATSTQGQQAISNTQGNSSFWSGLFAPSVTQGSNASGYGGTLNNPSAYVAGG